LLLTTYYLLLTTYYLLLTTYCLLLTTRYLLRTTYYLLLTTHYLLPYYLTTYYLLPTTYYLLPAVNGPFTAAHLLPTDRGGKGRRRKPARALVSVQAEMLPQRRVKLWRVVVT